MDLVESGCISVPVGSNDRIRDDSSFDFSVSVSLPNGEYRRVEENVCFVSRKIVNRKSKDHDVMIVS